MSKIKLAWIVLLLPVLAILFVLGYIMVGTYRADHTDEIATAILFGQFENQDYQKNSHAIDYLNDSVLNAALSKRFQPGSNPMDAQVFFEKLGATCEHHPVKSIYCKLPKKAVICGAFWIEISIDVTANGGLKSIFAKPNSLFC